MEKVVIATAGTGIVAGIVFQDLIAALIISILAGILVALTKFDNNRRSEFHERFDVFDALLAVLSSSFAGIMGFLGAGFVISDLSTTLFITGMSAISGFQGLQTVKTILLDFLRQQLTAPKKQQRPERDHRSNREHRTTKPLESEQPPENDDWSINDD